VREEPNWKKSSNPLLVFSDDNARVLTIPWKPLARNEDIVNSLPFSVGAGTARLSNDM